MMSIRDAVLAVILSEKGGRVPGRTLLQKKIYLVSIITSEEFGFRPYFYGPYSSVVADELSSLVEAGFIKEEPEVYQKDSAFLGEGKRYSYSLTDAGRQLAKIRKMRLDRYSKILHTINADENISSNYELLSVAAKVHFIVSEKGPANTGEIKHLAQSFGWNINDQGITQVINYLVNLNLVTLRKPK